MNATYDPKTNTLTLVIKCTAPHPSSTGKTLLIATHSGQVGGILVNGKPLSVTLSAFIKP